MRPLLIFATFALAAQEPVSQNGILTDRDRADFLLVQRDYERISKEYQVRFMKEREVMQYYQNLEKITSFCTAAGKDFDNQVVWCADKPKEKK